MSIYTILRVEGPSTVATLNEMLKKQPESDVSTVANVIGDSFDTASDMSSAHGGLQAEIRQA